MSEHFLSNWISKFLGKVPLRTVIVVPFIIQIVAAVGLTGYLSFRNGQQAVNDVTTQLRVELTARVEQYLGSYLEMPHLITEINADAVHLGRLRVHSLPSEHYLWQQMQFFKLPTWIQLGGPQGEYLGVWRRGENEPLQIVVGDESTESKLTYYSVDGEGNRAGLLQVLPDRYDARIRAWYTAAVETGGPVWSEIYADWTALKLTVTASRPAYDETGNLLGICGVAFYLEDINEFLRGLEIGRSGQIFITERSGLRGKLGKEPVFIFDFRQRLKDIL